MGASSGWPASRTPSAARRTCSARTSSCGGTGSTAWPRYWTRTTEEARNERDQHQQGPRQADDDGDGRVRRDRRPRLAAVGGPASARALVGPADVPRDRGAARPHARRAGELLHDRARGRQAARVLERARGRGTAQARGRGRIRRRERRAEPRHAGRGHAGRHQRPTRRRDDDHHYSVPVRRGDGAGARHGNGGGHPGGRGADRRDPRRYPGFLTTTNEGRPTGAALVLSSSVRRQAAIPTAFDSLYAVNGLATWRCSWSMSQRTDSSTASSGSYRGLYPSSVRAFSMLKQWLRTRCSQLASEASSVVLRRNSSHVTVRRSAVWPNHDAPIW